MAGFTPLASYRSVEVTSGTQVEDVEVVTSATIPTGIIFTWAVPLTVWEADSGIPTLTAMADYLETLVTDNHVVGGTDSQDFDVNNLLANFVDLTVAYDRSAQGLQPLYATAHVPIAAVVVFSSGAAAQGFGGGVPDPAAIVDAEYQRLAALAAA